MECLAGSSSHFGISIYSSSSPIVRATLRLPGAVFGGIPEPGSCGHRDISEVATISLVSSHPGISDYAR